MVSALEQNSRLSLGTRLRLPLLVNTIARDIPYIITNDGSFVSGIGG